MAQVIFAADANLEAKFAAWLAKREIKVTKAEAARHFVKAGMAATEPWLNDVTAENPLPKDERQTSFIED